MKAKLFKEEDIYYLSIDNKLIGSTYPKLPKGITYKLSLKNCDEIFGVVDVEELSMKNDKGIYRSVDGVISYRQGFNKAMQLNKDKVFTLEDMMNCWNKALKFQEHKETLGEYIQSIQQPTEIEVEIEMEVVPDFYSRSDEDGSIFTSNKKEQSKLDSEGCLILKKI
jgi:hypothetical protein